MVIDVMWNLVSTLNVAGRHTKKQNEIRTDKIRSTNTRRYENSRFLFKITVVIPKQGIFKNVERFSVRGVRKLSITVC